jgi:hypothetical protein
LKVGMYTSYQGLPIVVIFFVNFSSARLSISSSRWRCQSVINTCKRVSERFLSTIIHQINTVNVLILAVIDTKALRVSTSGMFLPLYELRSFPCPCDADIAHQTLASLSRTYLRKIQSYPRDTAWRACYVCHAYCT